MADTDDTARRLDEIRDREQWASPGPWSLSRIAAHDSDGEYCGTDNYLIDANREEIGGLDLDDDAEFAAHARDDIPYLLDLVAARDKEIAELQGLLADLCEDSRAAAAAVRYRRALQEIADRLRHSNITRTVTRPLVEWLVYIGGPQTSTAIHR